MLCWNNSLSWRASDFKYKLVTLIFEVCQRFDWNLLLDLKSNICNNNMLGFKSKSLIRLIIGYHKRYVQWRFWSNRNKHELYFQFTPSFSFNAFKIFHHHINQLIIFIHFVCPSWKTTFKLTFWFVCKFNSFDHSRQKTKVIKT